MMEMAAVRSLGHVINSCDFLVLATFDVISTVALDSFVFKLSVFSAESLNKTWSLISIDFINTPAKKVLHDIFTRITRF